MTRKITAAFPDGTVATRRSGAAYTHASRDGNGAVRFHTSRDAAVRRAGVSGSVAEVRERRVTRTCVVCDGTGSVTYGPSAVDGTYNVVPCHRCSS